MYRMGPHRIAAIAVIAASLSSACGDNTSTITAGPTEQSTSTEQAQPSSTTTKKQSQPSSTTTSSSQDDQCEPFSAFKKLTAQILQAKPLEHVAILVAASARVNQLAGNLPEADRKQIASETAIASEAEQLLRAFGVSERTLTELKEGSVAEMTAAVTTAGTFSTPEFELSANELTDRADDGSSTRTDQLLDSLEERCNVPAAADFCDRAQQTDLSAIGVTPTMTPETNTSFGEVCRWRDSSNEYVAALGVMDNIAGMSRSQFPNTVDVASLGANAFITDGFNSGSGGSTQGRTLYLITAEKIAFVSTMTPNADEGLIAAAALVKDRV
jgi:hypothetical protein